MIIDLPPQLIIPKPAIIRPFLDVDSYFPVKLDRQTRRAIMVELEKLVPFDRSNPPTLQELVEAHPAAKAAIPFGMFAASSVPFAINYINTAQLDTNLSSYDFGSFTTSNDGYIIVSVVSDAGASRTISSVSIGGTNGTIYAQYDTTVWVPHGFAYRNVAAGSHNVTVTFSGSMNQCAIIIWLITGSTQTAPNAGANSAWAVSKTTRTPSFNIPTNGVAAYMAYKSTTTSGYSWSSATERVDAVVGTGRYSGADKTVTTAITPHTETVTFPNTTATGFGISWGP